MEKYHYKLTYQRILTRLSGLSRYLTHLLIPKCQLVLLIFRSLPNNRLMATQLSHRAYICTISYIMGCPGSVLTPPPSLTNPILLLPPFSSHLFPTVYYTCNST